MSGIILPHIGTGNENARLVRWLKADGEHVEAGQRLAQLDAPGASIEIVSAEPGMLIQFASGGSVVTVGDVIGEIQPTTDLPGQDSEHLPWYSSGAIK